jgi:mannosylglucosylglycerate synthase
MNIGFISTRLAGNDGVSLETAKWAAVLRQAGHNIFYCAGELEDDGPPGMLIPEVHFVYPESLWIREHSYGTTEEHPELRQRIEALRATIKPRLEAFIAEYEIDLIIPQNIFAVPIQFPLAMALTDIIAETNIPTVSHNHDFYWERTVYQPCCVQDILDTYFPPDLPSITHVGINSLTPRDLKSRRGIDSLVVPNVFDFETPPPELDDYNADFREVTGFTDDDIIILAPVRIIHRKGLELAVEIISKLNDPRCKLVFTHSDDASNEYLNQLKEQATRENVDLRVITEHISSARRNEDGKKIYILWDAYIHADFVAYPSLYEGFGNGLLEAIYFRKPILINRYPVYVADMDHLGFDFVELDGSVTDDAVTKMRAVLDNPALQDVENNYQMAEKHFSHSALAALLDEIVQK